MYEYDDKIEAEEQLKKLHKKLSEGGYIKNEINEAGMTLNIVSNKDATVYLLNNKEYKKYSQVLKEIQNKLKNK